MPPPNVDYLTSVQWKAKIDAVVMKDDGLGPMFGELKRVAAH